MNRDLIADYLSYILFKAFAFVIRNTPKRLGLFLGRRIGECFYYFDLKHKSIAYSNIKAAFGKELPPCSLSNITREFYRYFVKKPDLALDILEKGVKATNDPALKSFLEQYHPCETCLAHETKDLLLAV